jgi:hypothetical protein
MRPTRRDVTNPGQSNATDATGPPRRHRDEEDARAGLTPSEIHALLRSAPLTTAQSHARGTKSSRS